LVIDPCM